jgi:predicted nucleic acid-binding protein
LIAPDTSVLVAGFVPSHLFHDVATAALAEVRADGCLIAHTMAETYSVLSAPSGPYRVESGAVVAYLDQFLDRAAPIQPRPEAYREALGLLGNRNRAGGAVYDALIALAARDAGAALVSLDRRAERTYGDCGVEARLLAAV